MLVQMKSLIHSADNLRNRLSMNIKVIWKSHNSPRTVRFFNDESTPIVAKFPIVETEDTDEASSSFPPITPVIKFVAVEFCLFFLGMGGRILPGNSVRSFL